MARQKDITKQAINNLAATGPPQPTTGRFLGPPAHRTGPPRPGPSPNGGGTMFGGDRSPGGGHGGHPRGGGPSEDFKEQGGSALRQLRRKAGVTRAELKGSKKLNRLAGALGVGVGPGPKRGLPTDKGAQQMLVKALRDAKYNPKGMKYDKKLQGRFKPGGHTSAGHKVARKHPHRKGGWAQQ